MPRVEVADDGPLRLVTLCHPEKKNALTRTMLAALADAFDPSRRPASLRAVVLTGEGATFSSGFFTEELDAVERDRGVNPIEAAAQAIAAYPVPVIAAVQGACFGGAVEVARAATFMFAAPACRICIPAVRLGLMYPASGLERLFRRAPRAARRLLLSGDVIDGDAAFRLGLVDELSATPQADAAALALRIANGAPLAVRGMKQALDAVETETSAGREPAEIQALRARALASDDLREGLAAAAAKRAPHFGGT